MSTVHNSAKPFNLVLPRAPTGICILTLNLTSIPLSIFELSLACSIPCSRTATLLLRHNNHIKLPQLLLIVQCPPAPPSVAKSADKPLVLAKPAVGVLSTTTPYLNYYSKSETLFPPPVHQQLLSLTGVHLEAVVQ